MRQRSSLPVQLRLKLISSLLEFMRRSGVSDKAIKEAFDQGLLATKERRAKGGMARRDGSYVGNGNVSAELLRVWHRDSRYLDRDANPKALPLLTGRGSLRSLIRILDPNADAVEILRGMRTIGLIRKVTQGRYLPTSESVTIAQLHPLAVEHVAKSVIRLVSTVCRNTDPHGQTLPLIERYAYVPDLNRADSQAFAEFTRVQGMAYLQSVDDWLEQRRARRVLSSSRAKKEGITAGVHLVAYLGDGSEGGIEKVTKRARKINKSSRTVAPRKWRKPTPSPEAHA